MERSQLEWRENENEDLQWQLYLITLRTRHQGAKENHFYLRLGNYSTLTGEIHRSQTAMTNNRYALQRAPRKIKIVRSNKEKVHKGY